jgi:hypothetical protein
MQKIVRIFTALALVLALAIPVLGGTVETPVKLTVKDISSHLVGIDLSETSDVPHDGRILRGMAALATFDVFVFDRNGEADLGSTTVPVTIHQPGPSGNVDWTTTGTTTLTLTYKTATGWTAFGSNSANIPLPTDARANDGIKAGAFRILFDQVGDSPAGVYGIEVGGAELGGVHRMTLVVYDVFDFEILVVDSAGEIVPDGSIDFGSTDPGAAAAGGFASDQRLQVTNKKTTPFKVSLAATDLKTGTGSAAYELISAADALRIQESTTGPAAGASSSSTPYGLGYVSPGTLTKDQQRWYSLYLDGLLTGGQTNQILADGAYAGTVTVTVTPQGGAGPSFDGTAYGGGETMTPSRDYDAGAGPFGAGLDLQKGNPDALGPIVIT